LKSTETQELGEVEREYEDFSNFGSLKSTETSNNAVLLLSVIIFQQFRLVEEH